MASRRRAASRWPKISSKLECINADRPSESPISSPFLRGGDAYRHDGMVPCSPINGNGAYPEDHVHTPPMYRGVPPSRRTGATTTSLALARYGAPRGGLPLELAYPRAAR